MIQNKLILLTLIVILSLSGFSQSTKRLSKTQKQKIDSLTISTLQKLSYEKNRFQIFDSQLKNHIMLDTDNDVVMDSIMAIERRSLEIKTDHNKKLRAIMTNEQRPALDIYMATNKEYVTPSVPIMEINKSTWPDYRSRKNIIMSNILSLYLKNYNITYQRKIRDRFGATIGLTVMPKTQTPFVENFNNFIAGYNPEEGESRTFNNPLVNMRTSGYLTFLEFRYFLPFQKYMVNSSLSGFYVGAYVSHSDYNYSTNYTGSFLGIDFGVDAKADFRSTGGGITFGNQWIIKNRFIIDFTFLRIGLHSNSVKGSVQVAHDNIDLISYFEEVLDFNMGIWGNMKKDVVNDHEIDFKSNKSSTGFLTAIRLGYLF